MPGFKTKLRAPASYNANLFSRVMVVPLLRDLVTPINGRGSLMNSLFYIRGPRMKAIIFSEIYVSLGEFLQQHIVVR